MVLETVDDLLHVISVNGVFLYCSPSCATLLEYSSEELLGKGYSAVCHPSDIISVMRELKAATASHEAFDSCFGFDVRPMVICGFSLMENCIRIKTCNVLFWWDVNNQSTTSMAPNLYCWSRC